MNKYPTLFLGHGNPMNAINPENPFNQGFTQIAQTFDKPKAILMISAHWYISSLQVQSSEHPPMIYDFQGFPEELYHVDYPAPGSPALAERILSLLEGEEIVANTRRGYDHGAWAVLKYLYPEADVPVVQLSIDRTKPASWHYALAKKLAVLREEGILIVGSGDIVHNLRAVDFRALNTIGAGYDWAFAFQEAVNQAIIDRDLDRLVDYGQFGEVASLSVPTPDHYLPLLYVLAVADADEPVTFFNDELVGGSVSMTSMKIG